MAGADAVPFAAALAAPCEAAVHEPVQGLGRPAPVAQAAHDLTEQIAELGQFGRLGNTHWLVSVMIQ